jgi:hypothetical protein
LGVDHISIRAFGAQKVIAMRLASLRNTMLFAAFAAVLVVAGSTSNARAEDDDDETTIDQKILRGLLSGIGLQKDRPNIEYRERSPLVVPPVRNLPPPETDAAVAKNPAWPNDAGDKRRKDAVADRHRKNFNSAIDDGRVLRGNEMATGSTSPRRGSDGSRRTEDVDQTMLKPYEMGPSIFSRGIFKSREESAVFTGEPPRTRMTEPPTGYRTPSASQPYGIGQKAAPPPPTEEQRKSKYGTNE